MFVGRSVSDSDEANQIGIEEAVSLCFQDAAAVAC
jgi:hypothetical protein